MLQLQNNKFFKKIVNIKQARWKATMGAGWSMLGLAE